MAKKKIKFNLGQALDNKRFSLIFSIILAVIIWFVVAAMDEELSYKVSNVPITIDTAIIFDQYELSQIGTEEYTVDVWVKGKSYKVGGLTADDLVAIATPTNISSAGTYDVEVKVSQKSFDSEYSIERVEPASIKIQVGRKETKEFELELKADNITTQNDDLIIGSLFADASKIKITGSEEELANISRVVLETDANRTITQTSEFEGELYYYDEQDNLLNEKINVENLETDLPSLTITVPILKRVEVSLNFDYINTPQNFDIDDLKPTISVEKVEIAAPLDTAEALSSINIATIDVRQIDIDKKFRYTESDIKLPAGCQLLSDIEEEIVIAFPSEGMASATFSIHRDNINIINEPSSYEVDLVNTQLTGVKIVGAQDVIDSLTADDLSGTIDLSVKSLQKGNITVPVKVYVQKDGIAWAVGEYTILVSVRDIS